MKLKKFISIFAGVGLLISATSVGALTDTNITTEEFPNTLVGSGFSSLEVLQEHHADPKEVFGLNTARSSVYLPSSVDLSESFAFPPIEDQGRDLGACAAFSSTYYQFSYEVNKLNSTTATRDNSYSPQWTYYYLIKSRTIQDDSGKLPAINIDLAHDFLKYHGGLHWGDYPYDMDAHEDGGKEDNKFTYVAPLPTDVNLMREALGTRISTYYADYITGVGTPITSPTDSDLEDIKVCLYMEKVLVARSDFTFKDGEATSNGEYVFYRCEEDTVGHSFVIVGYDDNFSYDVNGDGVIETAERGAFKIANSHGTGYKNNGFVWIMYDALNAETAISGNWEAGLTSKRVPAFARNDQNNDGIADNWFTYIFVLNYDVNFVLEATFSQNDPKSNTSTVNIFREINGVTNQTEMDFPRSNIPNPFTVLYDYSTLENGFPDDMAASRWGITCTNGYHTISSAKLTDNLGNRINTLAKVNNGTTSSTTYRVSKGFILGDVTYSNTITADDTTLIKNYISGNSELSNVQKYLADYNQDGNITLVDVVMITQLIE